MIRRIVKLFLILLCMGSIFFLSSDTADASSKKSDYVIIHVTESLFRKNLNAKEKEYYINHFVKYVRKAAHFSLYFLLGLLISSFCMEYMTFSWKSMIITILFVFLYACSDEIHQLFISGRSGKAIDVIIDTIGSYCGIEIYYFFSKIIVIIEYGGDIMNKKKQLAKNTIIIFMGRVCTQLISYFLLPLYTSYLATKEYGMVDLVQTYVTLLVPIITLELEMSIFRYLIDARGKKKDTRKLITNNFFVLGISLSLFSIFYLILSSFITIPYRFLILFDIIVCVLSGNFLQIARGFGRTIDYSISCILTGVTTIISNIIFICFLNMRADGMILSMAIANFICSLYLFFRLKMFSYLQKSLVDKKLLKEMFHYSIPLIPNGVSWWIVNVSDRSIISLVLGASANGLYAISNKFPTIISSLTGVFNLSWSESAALHINSSDRDEFFSDIYNTVMKLFTAMGVGMIACMPFAFPIFIDSKYDAAYPYIPFLVLGTVFNVAICLYSQVYLAKKLSKQVASTAILGAIINIIINVLFVKRAGLYAAAISTAISYFVMMMYRHIDLKKYVTITIEKGLILKSIFIYLFAIILYYQHNIYLHIFNLLIVCIYAFFLNKGFLLSTYQTILKKIFPKTRIKFDKKNI